MYKPFYPGAPRDIDEAARKIHRLLFPADAARRFASASTQVAQQGDEPGATADDDPMAGWPETHSPLSSATVRRPDVHALEGGGFGARRTSRGKNRPHEGIDVAISAGSPVFSPIEGTITHIGSAYEGGKHGLGSIHVSNSEGHKVKLLYVKPTNGLKIGQVVTPNTILGLSQSLQDAFKPRAGGRMTDHVHIEFFDPDGQLVDPTPWVDYWRRQVDNWERLGRRQEWRDSGD